MARAQYLEDTCKTALNRVPAESRVPFRWTINPYRGCTHSCHYCFARAFHTYLDLGIGEDFSSKIVVKTKIPGRWLLDNLASLPIVFPGLVLGLGYIMFFNHPANPLGFLYATMPILVLSIIVHYYTSSHLTAITALKAIDNEFEAVSASLKVPFYKTFFRVTLPVCLPSLLDIARYFFVVSMASLSGVVFLYSPDTVLASVAIMNLDEAGEIGPAAALASLIVLTSIAVCLVYAVATRVLLLKTQAWRSVARR